MVETHPDYRRLWLAANLVYTTAQYARERFPLARIYIQADATGFARKLYTRLGFTRVDYEHALEVGEA